MRKLRFSHFAALAILIMMIAAAFLFIRDILSRPVPTVSSDGRGEQNPPGASGTVNNPLREMAEHMREAITGRLGNEPRAPAAEPFTSALVGAGEIAIPPEESLAGLSVQTKDTLRLRYNLGLLKFHERDTAGAIAAFRSVLDIDPQGAYGRRAFLQMGLIYDEAGEFGKAIELFKKAATLEPLDPVAAHDLGIAYLHAKNFNSAVEMLLKAAQLDGANVAILQNLGNAYALMDRNDAAESSYLRALELDPRNPRLHFNLGLIKYRLSDFAAAQEQFLQASSPSPSGLAGAELGRALSFLGMSQYRRGFFGEAAKTFDRAATADPVTIDYRFDNAVALAKSQENAAAAAAFRQVLKSTPGDAGSLFGLGGVLYLDGKRNESLDAYTAGLKLDSAATGPLFTVGYIYYENGDIPAAIERFKRVVEIGGQDAPRAHVNLGLCYEMLGRLEEAVVEYAAGDPRDPRTFYNLGLLQRRLGHANAAVDAFEKAAALKPAEPKYAAALGDAYLELGRSDAAISAYGKAIKLGREDFEILIRLAQLSTRLEKFDDASGWVSRSMAAAETNRQKAMAYLAEGLLHDRRGDVAQALESFQRAESADQSNSDIYFNRGVILARELRYDEAVDALRVAIRLNPSYASAHTQLGNIFAARGLKEEAVKEYETAVAIDSGAVEANFNLKELTAR